MVIIGLWRLFDRALFFILSIAKACVQIAPGILINRIQVSLKINHKLQIPRRFIESIFILVVFNMSSLWDSDASNESVLPLLSPSGTKQPKPEIRFMPMRSRSFGTVRHESSVRVTYSNVYDWEIAACFLNSAGVISHF